MNSLLSILCAAFLPAKTVKWRAEAITDNRSWPWRGQAHTDKTKRELTGWSAYRLMLSDHLLKFASSSPSFANETISLIPLRAPISVSQSHARTNTPSVSSVSLISPPLFYLSITLSLWKHRLQSAKKKSTQLIPPVMTHMLTYTWHASNPQSHCSHAVNISLSSEQTASCIQGEIHCASVCVFCLIFH